MESTRELVIQIHQVAASGGQIDRESLLRLATAFVMACRRTNEKAKRCRDLLLKGMRREATQLAHEPPDLLQEANLLNFPGRASWIDICEQAGLELRQFDLNTEMIARVADELNTDTGTLDGLLKVHRRLALGKAPLASRLQILREIYRAASDRDFWRDDLEAFEAARIEELQQLVKQADKNGDLETLENILGEAQSDMWVTRRARTLAHAVEEKILPYRERLARERFAELSEEIRQAHSAMDEAECRGLLEQWRLVAEQSGAEPEPALAAQIAPVVAWLDELRAAKEEEAAFEEACQALETAIDAHQDQHALEMCEAAVLRFGRGMPERLAPRLNARLEQLQRAGRRKFALTLTAVIGALLLAGAGATALVLSQARRAERRRWQRQLGAALKDGELEVAGKILADLARRHPDLFATPEIQRQKAQHEQLVEAEEQRKKQFDTLIASIDQELDRLTSSDEIESPHLELLLKSAAETAETVEEEAQVDGPRQQYETRRAQKEKERSEAFDNKLRQLERLYAELLDADHTGQSNLARLAQQCVALADEIAATAGVPQAGRTRASQVRAAARQISSKVRQQEEKRKRRESALRRLATLYSRPVELADGLQSFGRDYPNDPLAKEFDQAAGAVAHWQAAEAWLKLTKQWGPGCRVRDAVTIGARLKQANNYLQTYTGSPHNDAALRYREYLRAAQNALRGGSLRGLPAVKDMFSNPLVADALVIRTKDGRAFYTLTKKVVEHQFDGKAIYGFEYIADGALTRKKALLKAAEFKAPPEPVDAPQKSLAKLALQRIQQFRGHGWETFYLRLAELVRSHRTVDPILRATILSRVLQQAARCAPFKARAKEIDGLLKPLSAIDMDVAWMDPDDKDAPRTRPKLARVLGSIKSLDGLTQSMDREIEAMAKSFAPYRPVGILMARPGEVRLGETVEKGALYVLEAGGDRTPAFHQIGAVLNRKAIINRDAAPKFPRGTPVFTPAK